MNVNVVGGVVAIQAVAWGGVESGMGGARGVVSRGWKGNVISNGRR